jgi:hypothetical protein
MANYSVRLLADVQTITLYQVLYIKNELWGGSEWLLLNVNSAIFQLPVYHGVGKLIFNEMMMRSALY